MYMCMQSLRLYQSYPCTIIFHVMTTVRNICSCMFTQVFDRVVFVCALKFLTASLAPPPVDANPATRRGVALHTKTCVSCDPPAIMAAQVLHKDFQLMQVRAVSRRRAVAENIFPHMQSERMV